MVDFFKIQIRIFFQNIFKNSRATPDTSTTIVSDKCESRIWKVSLSLMRSCSCSPNLLLSSSRHTWTKETFARPYFFLIIFYSTLRELLSLIFTHNFMIVSIKHFMFVPREMSNILRRQNRFPFIIRRFSKKAQIYL